MTFLNISGFIMSVIYIGAGVFLLINENIFNFSSLQQLGLGLILIAYGLFRFYNALRKKSEGELEKDEE